MIPLGVLGSARVAPTGGSGALSFLTSSASAANATIYTFPGLIFGTPSSSRTLIAGFAWRAASNILTASVTIGGVTATLDVNGIGTTGTGVCIASANVPTGTSGDVVLTLATSGSVRAGMGLWLLDGPASAIDAQVGTTSVTVTSGTAVGVAYASGGEAWSGLTQDFLVDTGESSQYVSGASGAGGSVTASGSPYPALGVVTYA